LKYRIGDILEIKYDYFGTYHILILDTVNNPEKYYKIHDLESGDETNVVCRWYDESEFVKRVA